MIQLLLIVLALPTDPVAREIRVELDRTDVSPEFILNVIEPPLQWSPRPSTAGRLVRLPSPLAMAEVLARLRVHPSVRRAQPSEPQLLEFDRRSASAMRRTVAAWKAAWHEYYALAQPGDDAPSYQRNHKIPKLGYLESYLEWFDARAYPDDEIDWDAYGRGRAKQDLMDEHKGADVHKWFYLGPTNLDTPFRRGMGLPPVNGRVNALAYSASKPAVIYAASACGGVWKTTSGGSTWTPFSDDWDELYTSAVAVDPRDSSVVYVGTGDFPGARGTGIGVMKSTDGGSTWQALGGALVNNKRISDIVLDPDDPDRVTVSTGRSSSTRIYQSKNGGGSWNAVVGVYADWYDLAIGAPAGHGTRYYYAACLLGGVPQVWRSLDRGETWEQVSAPSLDGQAGIGIDASRLSSTTVYLYAPTERRVFRSTTAGNTWVDITGDLDQTDIYWGAAAYNFRISCGVHDSPTDPPEDRIWIANTDAVRGTPSGAWEMMGGPAYSNDGLIHVDAHGFAQHPTDPNVTLLCNDGGVYRYDGVGFDQLSGELGCMLPNRLDVHPTDSNFLLGGTQDNGTSLCTGDLNAWYTIVGGDTGHVAINQRAPRFQYAAPASQLGRNPANDVFLWRTDDSWSLGSGTELVTNVGTDLMRHGTPIAIDPIHTNRIYFASNYLYRYDELTQAWSNRLNNQLLSSTSHVFTMAIAPSNGNWIYTGAKDREIWLTTDAGSSWERIDDLATPGATVAAISVDPTNPARVLVGYSSTDLAFAKLWECKNTRANPRVWQPPTGIALPNQLPNVPINAIARHPDSGKTYWYLGTDIGVFASEDQGDSWFDMTRPFGLPRIEVTDLRVNQVKYLFASTYGRGFWRIKVLPTFDKLKGG